MVAACGRLFPTGTIAAHFRPWTGSRRLGGLTGGIFRRRLGRPCGEGPRRMTIGGRRLPRPPFGGATPAQPALEGVLAFRPRWRHDLVRIRDEVICQLRERVEDAADLTADWLQGDLFALPVFLRLLEDLGYATAALRQDLEDGFDMLGEVRQAPLEAAGRRAVRQPVPPGNSPGEGGWLASPGFRHDLQNAYRQWAVKHPGHCGTFLPSAVVPLRHVLRGGGQRLELQQGGGRRPK